MYFVPKWRNIRNTMIGQAEKGKTLPNRHSAMLPLERQIWREPSSIAVAGDKLVDPAYFEKFKD